MEDKTIQLSFEEVDFLLTVLYNTKNFVSDTNAGLLNSIIDKLVQTALV